MNACWARRRMAWRAWRSASAVTAQVLTMTVSVAWAAVSLADITNFQTAAGLTEAAQKVVAAAK